MEVTFSNLRKKDVICINTGRNLGKINDLTFDFPSGIICAFIVPSCKIPIFGQGDKTLIKLENIKRIGDDAVLVDLNPPPPPKPPKNICEECGPPCF